MKDTLPNPILVTGGTGYLASWIIKYLLDMGATVHTTVRDDSYTDKFQHLVDIDKKAVGTLKIFEADLLKPGSFDKAAQDCEYIIHTASPFKLTGIENADNDLINPAIQGVSNIVHAAKASESLKRIVLTSSIVAMAGDTKDIKKLPKKAIDEKAWNTTSSAEHQPYPYSKTVAEKRAWTMVKQLDNIELVVINPALIFGPSLSKRVDSTSISMMKQICDGTFKQGVPKGKQAIVDVRDAALAHIAAITNEKASGRHVVAGHLKDFLDVAKVIKGIDSTLPLPKRYVPKFLFWMVSPSYGYTRKYVKRNMNYDFTFDNSYSIKDLGITYRPFEETFTDHYRQLKEDNLL